MKKRGFALLLALIMLSCATALAQPVSFDNYGFSFDLPDDWVYEPTALTPAHEEAGVVYGIDARSADEAISMWLEVYAFIEESRPATEITVAEFEGYVMDLRQYFPDASLFIVKGIPFVCYTESDDSGTYLTAYTWTASNQFGFVFFTKELTDVARLLMENILKTYEAL